MIPIDKPIYVSTSPVDLRASFDKLAALVVQGFGREPRDGALFVFLNRARNRIKILFHDHGGFCLYHKRLDRGTFPLPMSVEPNATQILVDAQELELLLRGLTPTRAPPTTPRPPRRRLH